MNKVIKLPKSNTKGRNSTILFLKSSNYFLFHKWYVKNADFPNHGAHRYRGLLYKMESFVTMVNVCQSLVPVAKLSNLHRYNISRNTLYANLRSMPWLDPWLISWLDSEGLQYYSLQIIKAPTIQFPAGNYVFKANKRNTKTKCEISSKLTIKIPGWCHRQLHAQS